MANLEDLGEREVSEDTISLTSTVPSAKLESYEVECILAERRIKGVKGGKEYLTAWKDYPEQDYLWEPRENFNEDEVFNDWEMTKIRIAKGIEKPFDVKAWMKRCKAITNQTLLRKQRRRLKRQRLSIRDQQTLEKGANVESSGQEHSSRQPDKQIKRRSVHQDPPPSSSMSGPSSILSSSSNPISEDSDRPLVPRHESEIFTASSRWTQAETIALEEGLRTLGPRWKEILSLYGRNGTVSQILKDKSSGDLYDKAKSVRQEFVDSGKEPPEYLLKPFSMSASSKGSKTLTPDLYSHSRGQSRAASKESSRSTSADSLMAELEEKQRTRDAKKQDARISSLTDNPVSTKGRGAESDHAKNTASRDPKPHKGPQTHSRKVGATSKKAKLEETLRATEPKIHARDAPSHPKAIEEATESSKDDSLNERLQRDGTRPKEPSRISGPPSAKQQPMTPNAREHVSSAVIQPNASGTNVLEGKRVAPKDITSNAWSGTARAPIAPAPKPPPPEAAGSGSIRTSSLKLKPKLGQTEPKKSSVPSDITATWNAEPKRRKSSNWATSNADPVEGQVGKRNYKLAVQNRIHKSRREGRAPDPNALIFIDPKTGKAPTTLPAPSPTAMVSRTPLQLYQEELAAREAEERQAKEVEEEMLIDISEPDRPKNNKDKSSDREIDEQEVPEILHRLSNNTSTPAPRLEAGGITDGPPHMDSPSAPPSASLHAGISPNTPKGPRKDKDRVATMSLQDYLGRSTSSTNPFINANINTHRPSFPDDLSRFTLRSLPSQEQKDELFKTADSNLVIGDIKFGKDDDESIHVKLVGFSFEVKKLILTIKSFPRTVEFCFEKGCLASEYQAYFPAEPSEYLGSGSIVPYHYSALAIENLTEILANNVIGALFFAPLFTMLIYPAGASAWAFLDEQVVPNVHPGTSLKFILRKPLRPPQPSVHGVATARFAKDNPERYVEIAAKIKKHPVQAEEKNINIVFRDLFEIDYGRLVAQNGPQTHPPTNIFFLCFVPQGSENYEPDAAKRLALSMRTSEEHDLFIKFLQGNGAEEIYSLQNIGSPEIANNGAWDYFLKKVKSGSIIFHDAFIRYDLVPRLAKHLLHGSVNVWKTSLSPMHPEEKHPHLVRLFPHGGVLLLTESLVLCRPHETLRIVMWFRRIHMPGKAAGTWKLAVRPRVREWLLDIMDTYSDSGKDIFGCSINIFAAIYTEIYWLLQKPDPDDNSLLCCEWDYETPTEEAPIVSSSSLRVLQGRKEWKGEGSNMESDDDNIRQNDDLLIQWFAEWAIVNLHNFRKYHVILGYTEDHPFAEKAISAYEQAWGHIEVMTCEEALARHKVAPQSKLDEMEAERRRKLKRELPAKRAAAAKGRKEERETARRVLEGRLQLYRDAGATEEEVIRAGRQLLTEWGGSEKEIEECKVDMDRQFVDRWWQKPGNRARRE